FPRHPNQHFEQIYLNTKVIIYLEKLKSHLHKNIDSTKYNCLEKGRFIKDDKKRPNKAIANLE
ncbi:hypothetical protein ACTQ5K_04115, partial [Niallia sp. Sow4_A1]|uniref:hypothetical protein n=1 Tax=Niallia sp. Sow4_A1 TaxID=3438793 RepID=UPI003F979F1D